MRLGVYVPAVIVLLSLTCLWLLLVAASSSTDGFSGSLRGGDRPAVEIALERYSALARNMSTRIQTAELVLDGLAKRQAELQKMLQRPAAVRTPAPLEGGKKEVTEEQPSKVRPERDELRNPEDEDETEEERAKRLEEEEAEQLGMLDWDPATKTFSKRWRNDYKCGDRVPLLPDGEAVECEPTGEAPCCSSMGWCGKSRSHCSCEMCLDYRGNAKFKITGVRMTSPQRECETNVENLGEQTSPEVCADLVLASASCGRTFMLSKMYPVWGCRCCAVGGGVGWEVKPAWDVYTIDVHVDVPSTSRWPAKPH